MSGAAEGQYVTFGLGDEVFAAPVGLVREILTYQAPSRIPNGPAIWDEAKNPIAFTAKAMENPVGDSPNAPV